MKTIGHHTCKKKGGKEQVEADAPYISVYTVKDQSGLPYEYDEKRTGRPTNYPFLGTGYYFWDNNLETAVWWGDIHYSRGYYVVKSDLTFDDGILLDLVGDRSSMIWLKEMLAALEKKGYDKKEWTLGSVIEFLKEIKSKTGEAEIFPYLAIRAIDYNATYESNYFINFAPGRPSFTLLDPRMIICLIEKNKSILQSVSIVHESN